MGTRETAELRTCLVDQIEKKQYRIFRNEEDPQGNYHIVLSNPTDKDYRVASVDLLLYGEGEESQVVTAVGEDWKKNTESRLYFTAHLEPLRRIEIDEESVYCEPLEESGKEDSAIQKQSTMQKPNTYIGGLIRDLQALGENQDKKEDQDRKEDNYSSNALLGATISLIFGSILWMFVGMGYYDESRFHGATLTPAIILTTVGVTLIAMLVRHNARYRKYRMILSPDVNERSIGEIATMMALPPEKVMHDLQKMVELEHFPNGFVDMTNERFVVDRFQPYEKEKPKEDPSEQAMKMDDRKEEVQDVNVKPTDPLLSMTELIEKITEEDIRFRLMQIRETTEKIDKQIKELPELQEKSEVKKFMEYYIVQVVDTVGDYLKVDEEHRGDDLKTSLLQALCKVEEAAQNVWAGLYAGKIADITVEMDVLKTMLAKDGYLNSDFGLSKKPVPAEEEQA